MKNIAKLGAILREWWKSGAIYTDPSNPTIFDHPFIREYMNRIFQEKKEADARLEKIIATAVVKFSMSKMGMNKEEALQAAREAVAFLRDVRAKKLFEEGRITEYGYEMYNRFIHSAWVKGAVKAAIKHTGAKVKLILKTLVMKLPYGEKVLQIIKLIESVIPEETKQKVKEKAEELVMKAAEEFPKVIGPMIEQGYKVAKKIEKIVSTGIEKAVDKGREFVENHPFVKKVVEAIKILLFRPLNGPMRPVENEDNTPFGRIRKKIKEFGLA